jgi:hypothetical protein
LANNGGMKNVTWLLSGLCLLASSAAQAVETPPLQFVTEYIRDFGAIEHIRLTQERELGALQQPTLATCTRSGNQYRSELTLQVSRMRRMLGPASWRDLPARLARLYDRKLVLYTDVVKTCTALGTRAHTNVSSLDIMTAISQYNAKIDAIDEQLFQTSTDTFNTLLGTTLDRHGKLRRLSITTVEKQALLRQIQLEFGTELDDDQQTYLTNAATVIRDFLRSHAASDES